MTFNHFLDTLQTPASLIQYPVISFQGSEYPLLFFSLLCAQFKAQGVPLEIIDCAENDVSLLESKFQTSFLGMQLVFWLKNSSELNERTRKWLFKFIADYQGPHTILFFASADNPLVLNKQSLSLMIPQTVDQKAVVSLVAVLSKGGAVIQQSIARMGKGRDGISLDSACLLMHYAQVLGANTEQFSTQWLDKIITPERSLFALSTHFFAKKPKLFFELWTHVGSEYSDVFWVSYWSEIIWRAHHYVALTKAKQFGEAKKISNRLPFTFIQRDWKLHSSSSLKEAHQKLYEIDFALKNGASQGVVELFYSQFFNAE